MRKIKCLEIAEFVQKGLLEKGFNEDFNKILQLVDDSVAYNNDYDKDENGEIAQELSEEEIDQLKNDMLYGTIEYYEERENI